MIENCQKVYQDGHIQIYEYKFILNHYLSLLNVNWIYSTYIEFAKYLSSRIP